MKKIIKYLTLLYGEDKAPRLYERAQKLIDDYRKKISPRNEGLTERDSILILYADQVRSADKSPLQTLQLFSKQYLKDAVSGLHILPFYPSTSDDGFSVADYRKVDPEFGNWDDIASIRRSGFRLMFDGVINHVSSQSEWFKSFLQNDSKYKNYFIAVNGSPDLSQVVRPRTLPLLTSFQTPSGEKRIWTTFSADQVDLNYKDPEVLFEILDVLLMYIQHGADFIRLDAVAYLWKEAGTACIHLLQTHLVVRFLRAALDQAAPHVRLITETNVPHEDNLSYFGDGTNEAHLIYNFALPPLTLHAFQKGNAQVLSDWAGTLSLPSDKATFFNFLASHDGIGLNPVRGILSSAEIDSLVERTLVHGGLISSRHNPGGIQSPYEMNINYFDALSNPNGSESLDVQIDRFMTAQAIMLSLPGLPGIYFHSLFGSRGWNEGVKRTGHPRAINREKYQVDALQNELADENSLRARVFRRYCELLKIRSGTPAFHPHGAQKVLNVHPALFAIERISPDGTSRVLCLHNVSAAGLSARMELKAATDLFTSRPLPASDIVLGPHQFLWMKL